MAVASGWNVFVFGRSKEKLDMLIASLGKSCGAQHIFGIASDIKIEGVIVEVVAAAAAQFGRIDAVVDCLVTGPSEAGVMGAFESTDPNLYGEFIGLSLVYLERLAHAAIPWLKVSQGSLLALVSDAAMFPAPRQALLGAARAAALGFVKNLAAEVARDRVRVNAISLSYVDQTAIAAKLSAAGSVRFETAKKRAGLGLPRPDDVSPAVLFLCGDGARKITGQAVSINGGLNI
ncbi:SDR family oxidoreductase [Zhongshania sp. CAU 1632]|uniref:SDR family oxidoreductase n=2 Tax=Zhongshania aquimaris TaxID=2857107 RepID=A0ABS6VYG9_9GAMM|nr:SDR family oxidoreductase [Zhongshania aquimaris]